MRLISDTIAELLVETNVHLQMTWATFNSEPSSGGEIQVSAYTLQVSVFPAVHCPVKCAHRSSHVFCITKEIVLEVISFPVPMTYVRHLRPQ